ncbi:hypothetical protein EX30DRAFT_394084 [Ascodesmis nigricans]|uniref:GET complex, subunit GET2 n=1 Tax=Ascodesmis nigricans TaxID=341454 RepID=A0A4V3SJ69_9PEZI|nr:hypothetical protein EX30DRAFT_394084 [Ascodesmis nigricans]
METPQGTPTMSSPEPSKSPLTPAEQARIRRERRQAKVREGAGSRLDKITSTQGLTYRTHEDHKTASPSPPPVPGASASLPLETAEHFPARDPPDIDLSSPSARTFHTPTRSAQPSPGPQDDLDIMRQLMGGQQIPPGMEDDPLLKLMASLGGGPGKPGAMPDFGGLSPGLASMMGAAGVSGPQTPQEATAISHDWIWRIVHGISSLMLAVWVLMNGFAGFDGSEKGRERIAFGDESNTQLFWYFATMELVLQSTRFMIEKGRPPQNSMLTTIAGFIPHPFGVYLTTLARYSTFLTVMMADAGVVIFCLGMATWWNS